MNRRQSVRVFIVQNGRILFQEMADSSGNLLVDSIGSFVTNEDNLVVIHRVIGELLGDLQDKVSVTKVAEVHYTIHKKESNNNQVFSTVFLGQLDNAVVFKASGTWKWYAYADIPYDLIYPDVKLWLPRILNGELLDVKVEVNQTTIYNQSLILNQHIQTVAAF